MVLPVFVLVTDAGEACAGGEEGECVDEGDSSQNKREKGTRKEWKASLTLCLGPGGNVHLLGAWLTFAPCPFLLVQALGCRQRLKGGKWEHRLTGPGWDDV